MKTKFQIFGSETSQDWDVMFFVDDLKSIQESHELISDLEKEFDDFFYTVFPNIDYKEVNGNLGVVKDGVVTDVFKGTYEEVNNSMFLTYDLHPQVFENEIMKLVERDIWLKVLRTARVILSFYSRSEMRSVIKPALRGDILDKYMILSKMDLTKLEIVGKRQNETDVYKVLAFQFGQTLGLISGVELYSKEDISKHFPELKAFLSREKGDISVLQKYLEILLPHIKQGIDRGEVRKEY